MAFFVFAISILLAGAFSSLLLRRRGAANVVGGLSACAAGAAGLAAGIEALAGRPWDVALPWAVPMGSLHLAMDGLSGWFVALTSLVCGLAGIYGAGYLKSHAGHKNLGAAWAFYLLLTASMLVVLTARNAVFFLVAWEIMSLASFFLVLFDNEREGVLEAGWTYLIATHLGTAFLLAMFVVLGGGQTMEFGAMGAAGEVAGAVFILAVVGFGTKAGFMPLHVWLPEAHPAAPSHVSAVMSGVMIKTGIYGLVRVLTMLGTPAQWWGWTLIGVGAVSGLMGVLLAIAQHDLKRLLAYHSVENIGIIAMGLGLGLLGVSLDNAAMAVLGFSSALLHVLNHAVFKGLLFFGAGSVLHAAGTGRLNLLGGMLKPMRTTGTTFLIGSAAICGLPPLNGFVSEFLLYVGSFGAVGAVDKASAWGAAAILTSLAMIGGLAAACFAKAFGIVFLGEPRTPQAAGAREASIGMRIPMLVLAGACVVLGLAGPLIVRAVFPAVEAMLPVSPEFRQRAATVAAGAAGNLAWVSGAALVLGALVGAFAIIRKLLLRGRTVCKSVTWDCGYAQPTPRMQYTASSFASPILETFTSVLRPTRHVARPSGLFPSEAHVQTHTADPATENVFRPAFGAVAWVAGQFKRFQQGRIQLYVLYVGLAALALLAWKLGGRP
jgi:formate hydrogenlyase subunit 3/multisubunit Na+/H+ antiporter MnhD subunit